MFLCGLALFESLAVILGAEGLMGLFIDNAAVVSDGTVMLRWQAAGMVFAAVVLMHTCLFQAGGRALCALIMSLSRQGLLFAAVFLTARTPTVRFRLSAGSKSCCAPALKAASSRIGNRISLRFIQGKR